MKTIALRFADTYAPEAGTIAEHDALIMDRDYVWYGKFGLPVSQSICDTVLREERPRILLVNSCKVERYWAYVDQITRVAPCDDEYPVYYRDKKDKIKTWFRVRQFEKAEKDICSKCIVSSSGNTLSNTSRASMSPYFIIDYKEEVNE